MGIIIPEGFSQATMIWSLAGSVTDKVTTLGLLDASLSPRTAAEIAEEVYNAMRVAGSLWASANAFNEWTLQGVSVILMDVSGPLTGEFINSDAGAASGESIPTNCAVLIKKNTSSGGRKNRGRNYWPPYKLATANCTAAGEIGEAQLAAFQGNWDVFYDELVERDLAPTLFHSDATAPTGITGFSVESRIATQRRRIRS